PPAASHRHLHTEEQPGAVPDVDRHPLRLHARGRGARRAGVLARWARPVRGALHPFLRLPRDPGHRARHHHRLAAHPSRHRRRPLDDRSPDRAVSSIVIPQATEQGPSAPPARVTRRRVALFLRQNWLFAVGLVIVGVSLVLAVLGPVIAPYDPQLPTPEVSAPPPSLASVPGLIVDTVLGRRDHPVHWFGTELTGLDIFSRVLAAPRVDVVVGVSA